MTFKYLLFPFLLSLLGCLLLARLAPALTLMDRPDARKRHAQPVPVVGGIAIMLAYLLALKLRGLSGNLVEAILPVGLLLSVGVMDDVHPLSARVKLMCQLVAGWLLLKTTGYAGDTALLGESLAYPAALIGFVAVVNAINLSDGADGLVGGYLLVALTLFAVVALVNERAISVLLLVGLMSAVCGFLVCNMRHPWQTRARVFLGDAGALSLGALLCWFAIDLSRGDGARMPSMLLLYACALPVLDMLTVSLRRMLNGRNPMQADRSHIHHLLILKGLSVELSVPLLWGLQAAAALVGFVLWRIGFSNLDLLIAWSGLLIAKLIWFRVWESGNEVLTHSPDEEGEP